MVSELNIVGGHGGGICPWSPSWDLLAGTEQGILGERGDGIRWGSQSWVLLAGVEIMADAEIMTGKLIET